MLCTGANGRSVEIAFADNRLLIWLMVQRFAGSDCKQFRAISRNGSETPWGIAGASKLPRLIEGGRCVRTSNNITPNCHTSVAAEEGVVPASGGS